MTYTVKVRIATANRVIRDTMRNVSEDTVSVIREDVRRVCPTGATYSVKVTPEG